MKFFLRTAFLLLLLPASQGVKATHLMGGEITWACQGDGRYIFTMKLYRDCAGVSLNLPVALRVHGHPTVSSIGMSLVSQTDISPQCNGSGPTLRCATAGQSTIGATEEFVFRSVAVSLPGVPPPTGWIFTFDDCCRNEAISNLIVDPRNTGFTLRAIMYPYNGRNSSPCYDSSPVFAQRPTLILCSGNPFVYSHNAYDPDKDSIAYDFGSPLEWLQGTAFTSTNPPPVPWQIAYSINNPFPGPEQSGSVPASLNPHTGEIAFTPNHLGSYVTVVKVSSYRCEQLISEIFREIQVTIIFCGDNLPPQITAPFPNTVTGHYTEFTDTVMAGDLVHFTLHVSEDEWLPIGIRQSVSLTASGGQFGTGFTDPDNGCPNPPCATLDLPPPHNFGQSGDITFTWPTSCNHVAYENCNDLQNMHTFVLTFQDDYCPSPSYRVATISIIVTIPPPLPAPLLRCADVSPNGDVEISWIPTPDPRSIFNSYHVFVSGNREGPYTKIDSIFSIGQSSYTHNGAGADTGPRYYYIRTRSSCEGEMFSSPSDTLSTIFLVTGGQGAGEISLQWNPLHSPDLPTTQPPYTIYKQVETGPFALFGTTANIQDEDAMEGCLQYLHYYVEIPDQSGCRSRSNIDGGPFSNDEPPAAPLLDSVSVNHTNNSVIVGWSPSLSEDTRAYVVYRLENGVAVSSDTVYGITSTSHTITGLNPGNGPLSFSVAAIDQCNNLGEQSTIHTTLYLQHILYSCENRVQLSWNVYEGWGVSPQAYRVFVSEDGQPYTPATQVAGTNTSATLFNLTPSSQYCYIVQAVAQGNGATSTSHRICFDADVQVLPGFSYVRKATVLDNGQAWSHCYIDNTSDLASYRVQRALYPGGNWGTIFEAPVDPAAVFLDYTDGTANTSGQSYQYRYLLIDKCELVAATSNPGRTILLNGLAGDGYVNRLRWNSYAEWDAGVEAYRVLRSGRDMLQFLLLAETGTDTVFNDPVIGDTDSLLTFCYRVEAVEAEGNAFGFRDTSRSNIVCITQRPTVYIPNTFRPSVPQGNNTFKAKGLYEKIAADHEFRVFNRWGEEIFYTADPQEAWDGKYRSAYVPTGVYIYRLRFTLPDGELFDKKGAVLVID